MKMEVSKDFFNNLKINNYDLSKFEGKDRAGFEVEDQEGKFKVKTFRIDWLTPQKHKYSTTLGSSFPPTAQKTSKTFEEALNTHFSVLDYLSK